MKVIRLYTGLDSKSHFEEMEMQLSIAEIGKISPPISTKGVFFGEIEDVNEVNWHNPPSRQYVIMLQGAMEIEIGDGTKKVFYEGDILLAEDTTGQGHITRAASQGIRQYLIIPLV